MASEGVRPGFNLDATFRSHLSTVRFVRHNAKQSMFLSVDDKSIKAWSANLQDGSTSVLHDVTFPGYQSTFVTALTVALEPLNLIFAACLDGHLRLYSDKLRLRSCMPWSNGAVRDMAFNARRAELLTAGSYGVKAWTCEMDHEAYRNDKNVDPFAIPRSKDGEIIPWGFGKYQHARQRCQYMVPGARAITTGQRADMAAAGSTEWCERILMHESTQTLFAMFRGSIYGFDAETGVLRLCFQDLHHMPVTSMIYAPDSDTLMTATLEEGVTVWRIAGGQPHRFRSFGKAITYLVPDDVCRPTSLLACSSDGSIALWALDGMQPIYRMKLASSLGGPPAFYARNRIMLHLHNEVRLFSIQHLSEVWSECNAAPTQLRALPGSGGLVLAEFADSSVRLLDATSSETDKSCVTIPPQLSSSALQSAAVSLVRSRLYALLSSGELHVWQLARGKPPLFTAAWPHLVREKCCALTLLEGGSLPSGAPCSSASASSMPTPLQPRGSLGSVGTPPPGAAAAVTAALVASLHLTLDERTGEPCEHLVLGTSSGDVLVVDADHGGAITARFPAFRQQAMHRLHLCVIQGKPMMLAAARCCLKVWSLDDQVRCLHVLDTSQQIRVLEVLGRQAILGTTSGSVHVVDVVTGKATAAASSLDHLDSVMGCGSSERLRHFVTCGKDSQIKVFDARKVLKRSIYLATPPSAICFLNDLGDLLVAVQRKLLVVRAATYQAMLSEDGVPHAKGEVLYPNASAKCLVSRPVHLDLMHPALKHSLQAASAHGTPLPPLVLPPVSGQRPASGTHHHAKAAAAAPTTAQAAAAGTLLPNIPKAALHGASKTAAAIPSSSGQPQAAAAGRGATPPGSAPDSGGGAAAAAAGDDDASSSKRPSAGLPGEAPDHEASVGPGHRTYAVVADGAQPQVDAQQQQQQQQHARRPSGFHEAGTASRRSALSQPSPHGEEAQQQHQHHPRGGEDSGRESESGSGSGSSNGSWSGSEGSSSGSGSGSGSGSESSSSSSSGSEGSEDDDEAGSSGAEDGGGGGARARQQRQAAAAAAAAEQQALLRQRQLAFLAENYKLMSLPFQTMFKLDLSAEAVRQQRKRFGLGSLDEEEQQAEQQRLALLLQQQQQQQQQEGGGLDTAAQGAPGVALDPEALLALVQGADGGSSGAPTPSSLAAPGEAAHSALLMQQALAGWGDGAAPAAEGEGGGAAGAVAAGLAARFRKLLPLLASPSALLDGSALPPELEGLLPPLKYPAGGLLKSGKGPKRRKKAKKDGKGSRRKKEEEEQQQQGARALRHRGADEVSATLAAILSSAHQPASAGSSLARLAAQGALAAGADALLQHMPAGDSGLRALKARKKAALAGLVQMASNSTAQLEPQGAGKESGKKKRRKKKKHKKGSALEVVDPARHLATVTRDHHVMVELKSFEKHRMLTRTTMGGGDEAFKKTARRGPHAAAGGAPPPGSLASMRDVPSFRGLLKTLERGWAPAARARLREGGGVGGGAAGEDDERQALAALEQVLM